MHVFRDGVIVFWNVPSLERKNVLNFVNDFANGNYSERVILEECETLVYTYSEYVVTVLSKFALNNIQFSLSVFTILLFPIISFAIEFLMFISFIE